MKYLVSLFSGIIFAIGLAISGMTRPGKVVGFLDVTGNWDPSLAFVMGGAVVVNLILYRLTVKRDQPIADSRFRIPTRSDIDWKLISGGALFGVGWGLAGYCPGPAIASIPTAGTNIVAFVGAMVGGMYLYKLFDEKVLKRTDASSAPQSQTLPEKISMKAES